MRQPLRVTCCVPTFNAGDTTRGVELARALVAAGASRGRQVMVTFAAPDLNGRNYEAQIRDAGFPVVHPGVVLDQRAVDRIMTADHDATEFFPDRAEADRILAAFVNSLRSDRPDLVVYGFVPPAGIAAQILGIPSVAYTPFPLHSAWVRRHLLKDLPEPLANHLTMRLLLAARQGIARLVGLALHRQGFFRQPTLAQAARAQGWRPESADLFAMLAADVELVHDLPAWFEGQDIGPRCTIAGPLFSRPATGEIDPVFHAHLAPDRLRKVFLSMGSSGEKPVLLAAITALASLDVHAVVVVPPAICSLAEVHANVAIPDRLLLTDAFVPAFAVNALADVAVIHGGQGTVQTALHAGTPVVGVGMQAEQVSNLDNLTQRGAGIRIARSLWTPDAIARAVDTVLTTPSFRTQALRLQQHALTLDGWKASGDAIWQMVTSRGL